MELDKLREEIDDVDKEIMKFFEKRMNISIEIANYKKCNNIKIYNALREMEVIERNLKRLESNDFTEEAREFLQSLMDLSKKVQKKYISEEK